METYVLKHKDKYLKFGSYHSAREVNEPSKSSLYSNLGLARRKFEDLNGGVYISNNFIREITIIKLILEVISEEVVV